MENYCFRMFLGEKMRRKQQNVLLAIMLRKPGNFPPGAKSCRIYAMLCASRDPQCMLNKGIVQQTWRQRCNGLSAASLYTFLRFKRLDVKYG